MTYSFNLIDRKWIPCVQFDGRVAEFSLRETLMNAHKLRGVQGNSPLETASIYRLLLAVLHSAIRGPRYSGDWSRFWEIGKWEVEPLGAYLDKHHDRFDLFHPTHPFYQTTSEIDKIKLLINIIPNIASGNNPTLFDHSTEAKVRAFTPAESARALLVLQTMSISGGNGLAPKDSQDAVWGRGAIFFMEGDNLFETLMLNSLEYTEGDSVYSANQDDLPAWERDDNFSPPRSWPKGYLDYLTWHSCKALLLPTGDENAPVIVQLNLDMGLKLDTDLLKSGTMLDPMKTYFKREKGYQLLRFDTDRVLWRDFDAFLSLKQVEKSKPPQNFRWVSDLVSEGYLDTSRLYRVMAFGSASEPGQAKVYFSQAQYIPLPLVYLKSDDMVEKVAEMLKLTELISHQVSIATFNLARIMLKPATDENEMDEEKTVAKIAEANKDNSRDEEAKRVGKLAKSWGIEGYFWSRLEVDFYQLLRDLPSQPDSAMNQWQKTLFATARDAFGQAETYVGADHRAHRARVFAREQFDKGLNRIYCKINPTNGGENNG